MADDSMGCGLGILGFIEEIFDLRSPKLEYLIMGYLWIPTRLHCTGNYLYVNINVGISRYQL